MTRRKSAVHHPSIFPWRKAFALPVIAQRAVVRLTSAIHTSIGIAQALEEFRTSVDLLDPWSATSCGREITLIFNGTMREIATAPTTARPIFLRLRRSNYNVPHSPKALLLEHPALALFFLFHPNGFLREAAIRRLPSMPHSAFFAAALLERRNDWVPEVRAQADLRFAALFPDLDTAALAAFTPVMLTLPFEWGRSAQGSMAINAFLDHPKARQAVVRYLTTTQGGPIARIMRQTLRYPHVDLDLPDLALHATSPVIRKIAAESLLSGVARWPDRIGTVWIDKSMGVSRRCWIWDNRPLSVEADPQAILYGAAVDRSRSVRATAADYVIGIGPAPATEAAIRILLADPAPGVTAQMAFYARKWASSVPDQDAQY